MWRASDASGMVIRRREAPQGSDGGGDGSWGSGDAAAAAACQRRPPARLCPGVDVTLRRKPAVRHHSARWQRRPLDAEAQPPGATGLHPVSVAGGALSRRCIHYSAGRPAAGASLVTGAGGGGGACMF